MAPGDVKLQVKNKEDFDVVRAGYLFPAKGDDEVLGEGDGRTVTVAHYRVTEITACRYLDVTMLGIEGTQDQERVKAFGEQLKQTAGSEDLEVEEDADVEDSNADVNATDGAKDLANKSSVDLSCVDGSGSGGRVTKKDVQEFLEATDTDDGEDAGDSITAGQGSEQGGSAPSGEVPSNEANTDESNTEENSEAAEAENVEDLDHTDAAGGEAVTDDAGQTENDADNGSEADLAKEEG